MAESGSSSSETILVLSKKWFDMRNDAVQKHFVILLWYTTTSKQGSLSRESHELHIILNSSDNLSIMAAAERLDNTPLSVSGWQPPSDIVIVLPLPNPISPHGNPM